MPKEELSRPHWVYCVQKGEVMAFNLTRSWCARAANFDWKFTSLEHALDSVKQGAFKVPCKECLFKAPKEGEDND